MASMKSAAASFWFVVGAGFPFGGIVPARSTRETRCQSLRAKAKSCSDLALSRWSDAAGVGPEWHGTQKLVTIVLTVLSNEADWVCGETGPNTSDETAAVTPAEIAANRRCTNEIVTRSRRMG